jgi:hypothetical protein
MDAFGRVFNVVVLQITRLKANHVPVTQAMG